LENAQEMWAGLGWHLTEDEARRLAVTLTVAADLAAGEPADRSQLSFDIIAA
jgi:hypothetical protein